MADWTVSDRWSGAAANPAQPSGLTQAAEQWNTGAWKPPPSGAMGAAPAWYGGRNQMGPNNGWDNDFYRRATEQRNRYEDEAMRTRKPSSFYNWLDTSKNPDATGVALWDDPKRGIRRGDVFDRGVKKENGNLFDVYDRHTANTMLGSFMFDGARQGRLNKGRDPAEEWRKAVDEELERNSQMAQHAETAERYHTDVNRFQEANEEWTNLGAVATGAAGGAFVGGGIGSIVPVVGTTVGAVAGGIIGGISGWMNRDQFSEVAARAKVTADRARAEVGGWESSFAALEGAGRVAMFGLQPFQNTVQGIYDAQVGSQGDARSEWYEPTDPTRTHGWVEAVNLGGAVLDAVGTFGNPAAATAYMWTMGATAVGKGGIMALDDSVFNERTGAYDDLEGFKEHRGAYIDLGIDVLQIGLARGLVRSTANARAAFGTQAERAAAQTQRFGLGAGNTWLDKGVDKVWAGVRDRLPYAGEVSRAQMLASADPAMTQTINGLRFFRTTEGAVVGARVTSQAFVPSEFVRWLPTGWQARQMRALDAGASGVDDLYRAAMHLSQSGGYLGSALLNAYGESMEELVQAYYQPQATGDRATWHELTNAAMYGGAAGLGMGVGAIHGRPNVDRIQMQRAYLGHVARTQEIPTEQEWAARWKTMSSEQRSRLAAANPEETPQLRQLWDTLEARHRMSDAMWSPFSVMTVNDARRSAHEKDTRNPRADNTLRLGGMSAGLVPLPGGGIDRTVYNADDAVVSAWDAVDILRRKIMGFTVQEQELVALLEKATQAEAAATKSGDKDAIARAKDTVARLEARRADTEGQVEMATRVHADLEALYQAFRDERDPARAEAILNRMNQVLDSAWNSKYGATRTTQEARMARRAVEFQSTRHPVIDTGSVSSVILRTRISVGLSQRGLNGTAYTHQSLLKTIGGDHDGDTRVTLNYLYLNPDDRRSALMGDFAEEVDVRPTEEQIKAGMGQRGQRLWKLVLDRPDDEAHFMSWFARWSSNRSSDQAGLVMDGLAKLQQSLLNAYSDRINPGNAFDHDVVVRLLNELGDNVLNGVADSAVRFTEALINSRPGAYQDFQLTGERNNRMEMPWLMQQFNLAWDEIQIRVSDYNYGIRTAQMVGNPAQVAADQRYMVGQAADRAVGDSYDLAAIYGPQEVRSAQHAHYTSFLHAAVDLRGMEKGGIVPAVPQMLARAYMELGSGDVVSSLDAIRTRDRVERRVLDWFSGMVEHVPTVAGKPHMMMILANTAVRDVQIEGTRENPIIEVRDGEISLLQLLLRKSLEIEEGLSDRAPIDDPIHAKIAHLKRLTRPQGPSSISASQAFMEVFGGFPIADLIGEKAATPFGPNITLGQLEKAFIGMNARERNNRFQNLRSPVNGYQRISIKGKDGKKNKKASQQFKDPPYSAQVYEQGLMNGYSVVVDALRATTSTAFRDMADQDKVLVGKLESGFEEWQNVLEQWRAKYGKKPDGVNVSEEELLKDFLRNAPVEINRLLKDLIPEASRQGAFEIKDGRVNMSNWVVDMLLEKNHKKAAAMYWVHTKLEDWRQAQGTASSDEEATESEQENGVAVAGVKFGRLRSRFLQSLYQVAADPTGLDLQGFMMNALNGPDIATIVEGINTNPRWLGNREKLLAFHDDVAEFESDPRDMWNASMPGSLQREAIRGWGDKIGGYGKRAVRAAVNREARNRTLFAMDQVLKTLPGEVLPDPKNQGSLSSVDSGLVQDLGLQNLYLLQSAIENAQKFSDGVGWNARDQHIRALQEGLVQMHNKGSMDRRVAPVGEATVLDAFGVKQGLPRETDRVHRMSFQDAMTNPTGLVEGPVRIMMPDGRTVDMDLSTLRGALNALMDERTVAFATAALFRTIHDVNVVNALQIYMDTEDPTDFTKMLQEQTLVHVLDWTGTPDGKRPTVEQAKRYLDLIESGIRNKALKGTAEERRAASFPLMSSISEFLINYDQNPLRTRTDREGLADGLIVDMAVNIRAAAKVPELDRPKLTENIAAALQDRLYEGDALARVNLSGMEKIIKDAGVRLLFFDHFTRRMEEIEDRLTDPAVTLSPEARADLEAEADQLTDRLDTLNKTQDLSKSLPSNEYRSYAQLYNHYKVQHGTESADMQKKAIVDLLGDRSRLHKFLDNKTQPVIQKIRDMAYHGPQAVYDDVEVTDEEWDIAANWAVQIVFAESTTRSGSTMRMLASADSRYFDKTGAYLADPLLSDAVLSVARDISLKAADTVMTDYAKVADDMLNSLFNKNKLGVWNEFVPIESAKQRKALETSPVGLAIPTAGIDPVAFADIVGATMLTTEAPIDEAEHMSTAVISSPDANSYTVRDFLNEDANRFLFVKLQNHFVKSVRITSSSPQFNAAHPDPDITALVASNSIQSTGIENSPYSVLHVDELQRMIDVWMENDGLTDYQISIEYVDVDKKPFTRQYANHVLFDGVGRASAANTSRGPIAAMIFALMGISKLGQQQPLDAATKGGSAYTPYRPTKLETIEEIERTSSSITELMQRKALHMWGIEYDTGHLLTSDLPALYKMVKMRHVIRVKDPLTGGTKLVWPEELIAQEARTGKPTDMGEVEIIGLSEDVSRALYGASGFEAVNTALNEPILNLEDMDKFPSLDAQRLERLGLARLGETASAGETEFATVVLPSRAKKSKLAGAQPKNLWKQRTERWASLARAVISNRTDKSRQGIQNFDPDRISKDGALKFASMIAAEKNTSLFSRLGIPMASLQDLTRTVVGEVLAQHLIRLKDSPETVIWQHTHGTKAKYSLADGMLTDAIVTNEFKDMNGVDPVYGDSVVIDLGSFVDNTGNTTEAFQAAQRTITAYAERGVTIVLGSEMGDQHFRSMVGLWLRSQSGLGYESLANSMHVFVPITSDTAISINQRALSSRNTAVEVIQPRHVTLAHLSHAYSTGTSEGNTYYDTRYDPQWKKTSAVILPTALTITDFDRDKEYFFNVPTGTQRDMVIEKLRKVFADPASRRQLIEQGKGTTDSTEPPNQNIYRVNKNGTFDPGIRSYEDALDVLEQMLKAGILPTDATQSKNRVPQIIGDFIVVVDQRDNIFLQRLGFALTSKSDLHRQMGMSPAKDQPALKIAVSGPKLEDGQTVSPPMRIDRVYYDKQRGMVAEGEWVLDPLAKMIWEGAGFKPGGAEIPEHWILPPPMSDTVLNRTTVTQFTSLKSPLSKGSIEGVVDNFRDAFVVFGFDARPRLVNFFFGKDPNRSQKDQDSKWGDVERILRAWSERDHNVTNDEAATLMDAKQILRYAREEIGYIVQDLKIQVPHIDLDSRSNGSAERDLVEIFLSVLTAPSVKLEHIVSTSGLLTVTNSMDTVQILRMPTIFTDVLDDASMYPALRKELFADFNSRLPRRPDGKEYYYLDEQWQFHMDIGMKGMREGGGDAVLTAPGYLQYIMPAPTSENPAGYVQSGIGRLQQQTQHVTNVLNATSGGRIAIDPQMVIDKTTGEKSYKPTATQQLYGPNQIMRFEPGSGQKFYDLVTGLAPKDDSYSPWSGDLPLGSGYRDMGSDKVRIYRQKIDRSDEKTWGRTRRARADEVARDIVQTLGLTRYGPSMMQEVDYLVRMFAGRPGPHAEQAGYVGDISGDLYIQVAELILTNVRNFVNPLHGGAVFIMDRHLVQTIYKAQEARPVEERWAPLAKGGKTARRAGEWEEWIDSFLGHYKESNQEFMAMFLTDIDGFFHTWHDARPGLGDLPVSYDRMRNLLLMHTKVNDAVLSLDPGRDAVLHDPIVLDSMKQTLNMLIGHQPVFNELHAASAYESDLAEQLRDQKKWLAGKGLPKQTRTKSKDYMRHGAYYRSSVEYDNQLMKNLVNASLIMRLANPALWFSALMEVPARNMLEHITNTITGRGISAPNRGVGKVKAALGMESQYDPENARILKDGANQLGERKEFLAVLYDEMAFNNLVEASGENARKISKFLQRGAEVTARATSDPRFGMTGTQVATRYLEAAMEYFALTGTSISPKQLVYNLSRDPLWLRKQYAESEKAGLFSPHRAGMNRVAQVRSQKQTTLAKMMMFPIDWMSSSNSSMLNFSGHLLRIPFMFTRFNINALMTITGLTAWDQAAAMFFDKRNKPKFLQRDGKPDTWNNTEIIETIDLHRTFLRSGVTYSMVMALGMMAGGLGGDDEEERRRKRLMQNLNLPHYLDPADSQNAFTNAEAIYLDGVPILGNFFKGAQVDDPATEEDERRAVVVPHWIVKQFTSPIIGMSRFFENGDIREIGWGFGDAFSAMPNSVKRIWDEAEVTNNLLAQQASEEANKGTALGQANATSLIVQIVGVYERALMENSFANSLYNAWDKYDRNPYIVPERDPATGEIVREPGTGLPKRQKDALVSYIDEHGDVQQAYMTRQGKDGELHQYAENHLTFALLASLFSGLGDSSFLRKNMAPRQQFIERPDVSLPEFEAFVMSAYKGSGGQQSLTQEELIQKLKQRDEDAGIYWDQAALEAEAAAIYNAQPGGIGALSVLSPEGREVLTLAGNDSVFTSLANGALRIGDPALQDFAATQEMRDQLAALWSERLVQEGLDLGLGYQASQYRARRLWYGDNTQPDVPGLREIIYSRDIPKENDLVYNQLNMTYAIGPDGRPWATPFPKMGILQSIGFPIPTEMLNPGPGLALDAQGRIIDLTVGPGGINTGLSGLEKVVEVNDVKEPEDSPFEKALSKNPGKSYRQYGRRPSYGGGGGTSFTPSMRPLPGGTAARFDNIPMINTQTPFIRRADVNKQRIWSERGRLKQWQ